jgi:hypothetical protein
VPAGRVGTVSAGDAARLEQVGTDSPE